MVRLIKRYESRKLYDTEESRYVSLDEIGVFVREGQQVRVVDNGSKDDVTAQTLTQIILGEGRNGKSPVSTEFLHDLLRAGERALSSGVQQVQQGVDRFIEASMDKLSPVRQAREEMTHLRVRLEELEGALSQLEDHEDHEDHENDETPSTSKRKTRKSSKRTSKRGSRKTTSKS